MRLRPPARIAFVLAILLGTGTPLAAQAPIPGYAERVHGEVLHYHSPLPDVEDALLVRSVDASRSISWRTAPVPEDYDGEWASFIWMFGVAGGGPHRFEFDLQVDGKSWVKFRNPGTTAVRDWTVEGVDGASLRFRATTLDRFGDLMGFATLRLPRAAWQPGEALTLEIVGESAGSQTFYMTFMDATQERAEMNALPCLVRGEDDSSRPIRFLILHLGEETTAEVQTSWSEPRQVVLHPGANQFDLPHPETDHEIRESAVVRIDGEVVHRLETSFSAVRPWVIDLVQHTHTDVGYTRPQTEILPEHLRYIDTALELCDATDGFPEDAQFRWTCEASWAVREYLESRTPEQVERLRRRVQEGRIEVTAMFLNMSEVVDEASYAAFLYPIRALRAAGLPVTAAMQNDINGAAWCLAEYAEDLGVLYLTMGQHGHRARIPFDMPTAFWWEAPSGNRLLAYRADHYQTGNFWGVHTGSVEAVEPELMKYLAGLEEAGYGMDRVAVQHSGYPTDNSPPSLASSVLVQEWNERFVWPRLRCAVTSDLPRQVEREHPEGLPVVRAAWPDWWTDGFGAAPRESAAARRAQAKILAVESLLAFERLAGLQAPAPMVTEIDAIRDALLFYGEHTFGAAESIREPFAENTQVQWAQKASYAWDAVKRVAVLEEGALGRLAALLGESERARLVVFNSLGFPRSGWLELYVDHELFPVDGRFRVVTGDGEVVPVQLLRSRAEGSYWALQVDSLPAFGVRSFWVEEAAERQATPEAPPALPGVLENAHYRVTVDPQSGGIRSLFDKELGLELVDQEAEWTLGQLIHEQLGNREQLEAFQLTDFQRSGLRDVQVGPVRPGLVWDSLSVSGELDGCEEPDGVRLELRLFRNEKRLELHYLARKRRVFAPESYYVAMPIGLPKARVLFETLGGVVAPEDGEVLPGSASDWQAIQNFVAVQGADAQVVLVSEEAPLVQLGDLNLGKFMPVARIERPHVFSWVMNNYWTTNFPAAPEGDFRWSYVLTSTSDVSRDAATRFGFSARTPALARAIRGTAAGDAGELPGFELGADGVMLVAARTARSVDGVVLHLREVEGQIARVDLDALLPSARSWRVQRINVIEDVLAGVEGEVEIRPFQSVFLLLTETE